jgi:hypothetical protein
MAKYETRILDRENAFAFLTNMRWFAGFGRITATPTKSKKGYYTVRASKSAWSNFIEAKHERPTS